MPENQITPNQTVQKFNQVMMAQVSNKSNVNRSAMEDLWNNNRDYLNGNKIT
jgi:hypothetical protein